MSEPKVTRQAWGFPIRHEVRAICDDGEYRTVEFGVADTFFTCPAKYLDANRRGVYGYVSTSEDEVSGDTIYEFHRIDDQREAKSRYRESIQF